MADLTFSAQRRVLNEALSVPQTALFEDSHMFIEMKESGITDEKLLRRAFQIYIELTEVRNWWNPRIHVCKRFNVIYLSGHPDRTSDRQFVLPICSTQYLSPSDIHSYIQGIQDEQDQYRITGITLALVGLDTNTTFYRVTDGLIPPLPPDVTTERKLRKEEQQQNRPRHYVHPLAATSSTSSTKKNHENLECPEAGMT